MTLPVPSVICKGSCLRSVEHLLSNSTRNASAPGNRTCPAKILKFVIYNKYSKLRKSTKNGFYEQGLIFGPFSTKRYHKLR